MTTAEEAPLKGVKLLTASPSVAGEEAVAAHSSVPSASNVFRVNTDFVAFFVHDWLR